MRKALKGKWFAMIAVAFCGLCAHTARADTATADLHIISISHQSSSPFKFFVTADDTSKTNPAGCQYPSTYAFYDSSSTGDYFKAKFAMVMAAYLYSKTVALTIDGSACESSSPKINQVLLK